MKTNVVPTTLQETKSLAIICRIDLHLLHILHSHDYIKFTAYSFTIIAHPGNSEINNILAFSFVFFSKETASESIIDV